MIKKKPLSFLSKADNGVIVCDYENEFIDFDNTKGILKRPEIANTPDMLYINDEKKEIWFVEFKSSNKKRLDSLKEKVKLRKKIFAGLFLLYEILCEKSCDYKNYDKFYFIVYNKEIKNSEDEVLNIFSKGSKREIEFGLEDLKTKFVKDILTEDCEELKKLFKHRFNIEFIKEKNEPITNL